MTTIAKPTKGKPQTPAQKAAVLTMEREVVQRHAIQGHSFYRIEQDLDITNADRIYKRAMEQRPVQERSEAYRIQQERLNALHEKSWQAIAEDGLDSLWDRLRSLLIDLAETGADIDAMTIMDTIQRAYADTYKGIPVALAVHDRFVKLDGLDHAARVADARLELDRTQVALMAAALVDTLADYGLTVEQQREAVTSWGQRLELTQDEDPQE